MSKKTILELKDISYKVLNLLGTDEVEILEKVSGKFYEGQVTGIIGKSGSGKSCLLRIIAGLLEQTSGTVKLNVDGKSLSEIKTSMVFQDFALFPWLNVRENIELGLRSFDIKESEIRSKAMSMIDLVGLDGFEDSYPKELSGGMKQRVGFARALISEPDLLLMDEPFSALDIMTAESLRADFIELWNSKLLPIKAAIFVSHDASDILAVCDRVCFMDSNKGQFYKDLDIPLKFPRDHDSKRYEELNDKIYEYVFYDLDHNYSYIKGKKVDYKIYKNICNVSINMLTGFLKLLNSSKNDGESDVADLGTELNIEMDDLASCIEFAEALNFVKHKNTNVKLTPFGKMFITSSMAKQKIIFADKIRKYIGIITELEKMIKKEKSVKAGLAALEKRILEDLSKEKTQQVMSGILNWVKFSDII